MPELPEVQTTADGIRPYLEDRVVAKLVVRERRLRWPVAAGLERRVHGRVVRAVGRRAKYLVVHLPRGGLLIHLGMSGSLRVVGPAVAPGPHDHFDLVTADRDVIRYRDPRRFGCLLYAPGDPLAHPRLANAGVEPLGDGFDGALLYRLSRRRRVPVKALIMDAGVVAGVGNIYAAEALFNAGIHPHRSCARIARGRYDRLADAIRTVLADAIAAGGTTLQDFTRADGAPGYFARELSVYGRAGEPCPRCARPVRVAVTGGRSTFYCAGCQH